MSKTTYVVAGLNVGIFAGVLIVFEIIHQLFIRKKIPLVANQRVMKRAEFEQDVWKDGRKYVLIDDLVVDVENFADRHPGGKFLIKHHIGRDISKYFHGGYSLEGNMAGPPRQGHIHSNYAKKIVLELCVARFEGNGDDVEPTETAMCRQGEINEAREVNEKTLTFVL